MPYKVITKIRDGEGNLEVNSIIPDDRFDEKEMRSLVECGAIEQIMTVAPVVIDTGKSTDVEITETNVKEISGTLTLPDDILNYVNNADLEGLEKIKGIGKTTAKAMLGHENFTSIEKLAKLVPNVDWTSIEIV